MNKIMMEKTAKINILIITDTYIGVPGGSERHLLNFLNLLNHEQFKVTALQFFPWELFKENIGMHENIRAVKFMHHPLDSIKSFKFIKLFFLTLKIVKYQKIDIVASYHEKSDLLNYCLNLIPGINLIQVSSKRDLGFKLQGILKKLMRFVTPKFNVITTPSHSIKKMLISEYKVEKNKIRVIANGVDLNLYYQANFSERKNFKKGINIDPASRIAICVGSLREVKGHEFLIRSFEQFANDCEHIWQLIIIGIGPLREALEELTCQLGMSNHVKFVGLQTNVEHWLAHSDIIVSSSSSEGLSNAIIEGIASGLPVIATNVGGSPELVHVEKNGILIEYNDQKALTNAFKVFDQHPDKLLAYGEYSRKLSEKEFSNEIMVKRLEELYIRLVSERNFR